MFKSILVCFTLNSFNQTIDDRMTFNDKTVHMRTKLIYFSNDSFLTASHVVIAVFRIAMLLFGSVSFENSGLKLV